MGEIKVFFIDPADPEAVSKVEGLVTPEVQAAIDNKLPVTVFLAAYERYAAGAVAGSIERGVFDIESIYVAPEYRRKGIGRALIERLRMALLSKDILIRAEYTLENREKEPLSVFFRRNGFQRDKIKIPCFYVSSLGEMRYEEEENRIRNRQNEPVLSFRDVPESVLKTASAYSQNEMYPIPKGGLLSEKVDKDLSFCALINGRVMAYIAVYKDEEGLIEIPALWSKAPDPKILMAMLKKTADACLVKYPPKERAAMMAINSISEKIIKHLFPKAEAVSYSYISYN